MPRLLWITGIIILLNSLRVSAFERMVVYGEDNRRDIFEVTDKNLISLAQSSASMIHPRNLLSLGHGQYGIYEEKPFRHLCSYERFAKDPQVANCSGFLIGEDLLLTAGHCMRDTYDCEGYKWVFNYANKNEDKNIIIGEEDIYGCKEVIETALNKVDDYALIRLDRSVIKQKPLEYRKSGSISFDDKVFLIGNPTGMPLKITDSGDVVAKSESRFVTNLDSYEGNSGSAVFNSQTNLVEGILVSGESDYKYDKSQKCYYSNVLGEAYGREAVTKITRVKSLFQ